MIMTVQEYRQFHDTTLEDSVLEGMLQALELLVRKYTNNNFQKRAFRSEADIVNGMMIVEAVSHIVEGDTIQISESRLNEGLFTVTEASDSVFEVKEPLHDETNVLVTKVEYPMDVKLGVVNLMKWDIENRKKVGIQSETISRHSVTYFNMDGDNAVMGYPRSLLGFLTPYKKARF